MMKAFEIRNMTDQEVKTKLEETYEEMFNLRFQRAVGQAKDTNRVKMLKRDVARLKTILNERQAAVQ
jgi:large subunit ribosomal protein L29